MTAILERPVEVLGTPPRGSLVPRRQPGKLRRYIAQHPADFGLAVLLALGAAVTRIVNLAGYPRLFTDEGVYVSQAWAVQFKGELAHYTYWYDHPPFGWVQMSLWSVLTGAQHRWAEHATMAGREYMATMAVVCAVLIYVLARRLGMRQSFAFLAGALYVLSPLTVGFGRYVLLDNIAVVWVLAAMVLALSPTRRLSAAIGCGACLAAAMLSKETAVLLAPAVAYLLWRNYWRGSRGQLARNRHYAVLMCGLLAGGLLVMYPLYALLKGELVPGAGHVSIWEGQILFQLTSREGSGNILQSGSDARLLAENVWLGLDRWLPLAGVVALLPALFVRRLWGLFLALGIQVGFLATREGYLPYPQIIMLLPFMALLIGGVADALWPRRSWLHGSWYRRTAAVAGVLAVLGVAYPAATHVAPNWYHTLRYQFAADETLYQRQAFDWVQANIDRQQRLVTEGEYWLDLRNRGFSNPEIIWVYKLDTDAAVRDAFGSVAGLDVLVLNRSTVEAAARGSYPTLAQALEGATLLQTFGEDQTEIQVLKVNAGHT